MPTLPLQPAVREYALSRALQLDPKCVPAWVALAELYIGTCQLCRELGCGGGKDQVKSPSG